jgi:hypothetical protein
MGEKHEQKLLKAIEDYRRISGFPPGRGGAGSRKLVEHLLKVPGVEGNASRILRRGRVIRLATSTSWLRAKPAALGIDQKLPSTFCCFRA